MVTIVTILALYITAFAAGFIGSILGLGGGAIIVPILDLVFGFDIKNAAASSIIAVVGTSISSSSTYVEKRITNVKLALILSLSAITGSFVGMFLVLNIGSDIIRVFFGFVLLYTTYYMYKKKELGRIRDNPGEKKLEAALESYYDEALGKKVYYRPKSLPLSIALVFLSGLFASLFGVGGGIVNVPVLALVAGVPLKVAIATSSLIILVTSTTSSLLQLNYGYVIPWAAGTLFLGTILGAKIGSRLMNRIPADKIRKIFVVLLVYVAVRIILKGLKIPIPI